MHTSAEHVELKSNMHTSARACRAEFNIHRAYMRRSNKIHDVRVHISIKHAQIQQQSRMNEYIHPSNPNKHQRRSGCRFLVRSKSATGDVRQQDAADCASRRSKKGTRDQAQGRPPTTGAAGREDDGDELLLPARLRSLGDSPEKAARGADARAAGREHRVETT
jgi:hypothetical protein